MSSLINYRNGIADQQLLDLQGFTATNNNNFIDIEGMGKLYGTDYFSGPISNKIQSYFASEQGGKGF